MNVFVGTSGWLYGWNRGGNLDWYLQNSGLNAVELNASFYRFPYKNQVAGWAGKGTELSIGVLKFTGLLPTSISSMILPVKSG